MRLRNLAVVLFLSASGAVLAQQNPPAPAVPAAPAQPAGPQVAGPQVIDPAVDPRDNRLPPPTPAEEREREIRRFDPLDPSNPADPNANGQTPGDDGRTKNDRDTQRKRDTSTPLPGSIAAEERANTARQGPAVEEEDADAPAQQYTGPAVLSRSYTVNRPLIPQDEKWTEFLGFSFIVDTGLTSTTLSPTGKLMQSGYLYGTALNYGLSGRQLWRHDQLGVHLSGSYQQYFPSNDNNYTGPNTTLTVDYTHAWSRRLSVTVVGTGTLFSQNYTLAPQQIDLQTSPADINIGSSPNIQIFDTTTKQFSLQTNVTWQKSTRLSFSYGGSYFAIVRDAPSLVGVGGEQANADVNYRLTSRTTIGAYYSYGQYEFQHGAGTTDTNTVGLVYSKALSRSLQVRLRGGVSWVESLAITSVPIDPAIAALLGQSTAVIDAYQKNRTSDISVQVVKDFRGGRTASLSYARGVSPGNGVFLTSEQESFGGAASMRLFRRYLASVQASRDKLSALTQNLGKFTSENASFSLSRSFSHGFAMNFLISYRYFNVGDNSPVRNEGRLSTGITWSPPGGRLWPL